MCMFCSRPLLYISPSVSEEVVGLGGRAVLAVVGNNAPEGTTVASVGTCAKCMKGGNALCTQHVRTD